MAYWTPGDNNGYGPVPPPPPYSAYPPPPDAGWGQAYGGWGQPDPRALGRPSYLPTFLVTFFFGIFGLIPAIRHSKMARERRFPEKGYWLTFGLTLAVPILLWIGLYAALLVAANNAISNLPASSSGFGPGSGLDPATAPAVVPAPPSGDSGAPGGSPAGLVGTDLAQNAMASDPAGDAAVGSDGSAGADLTGFSWSTDGTTLRFTVRYANFSGNRNATIYLATQSSGLTADCPGMPGATFRVSISDSGLGALYAVGGSCPDAGQITSLPVTANSDGWTIEVPQSDVLGGPDGGRQALVRVLSSTQVSVDSETPIQDDLPDDNSPPLRITIS